MAALGRQRQDLARQSAFGWAFGEGAQAPAGFFPQGGKLGLRGEGLGVGHVAQLAHRPGLQIAQADLSTRQLLLAQALQSMETSRIEANRQVRYLSLGVRPVAPDEPTYPRAFENTMVTMLIMLGIYLMVSMTAAILREQVSS